MVFDGKALAGQIEEQVKQKVAELKQKPKVVSILVGNNPASELYTRLKKQAAERVGIEFEVKQLPNTDNLAETVRAVSSLVDGMMIQLPIPGFNNEQSEEILVLIPRGKDIDGLRWETSKMMPATVRAVLTILERIQNQVPDLWKRKFVVVGGSGAVGRPLTYWLNEKYGVRAEIVNSKTENFDEAVKGAEVLISCVGKPGLITEGMIDPATVVIDVGSPKGDMTNEVYQKASVALPVPGGVGPVTIASLMQNIVEGCGSNNT